MYVLFSELVDNQSCGKSVTYNMGDEDYNRNQYLATLSATEVVASLIPCTVHDGVQSVS